MAKRKIVTDGDITLRQMCSPIDRITPRIRVLAEDMIETMRDADGVGLAGPQVGVLRRIVVIETTPGETYVLINPEITETSGEQTGSEGCLSVPGKSGTVTRPMNVTVEALDIDGNAITVRGEGLLARCLCHEIDHLDGILYTDIAESMDEPAEEDAEPERESPLHRRYRHRK